MNSFLITEYQFSWFLLIYIHSQTTKFSATRKTYRQQTEVMSEYQNDDFKYQWISHYTFINKKNGSTICSM